VQVVQAGFREKVRTLPRGIRWRAWIASLAVIIVAVAPLLRTLHQAFVRHAVCEHGDLVELGHDRGHSTLEGRGETGWRLSERGPDGSDSIGNASSASRSPAHAHCTSQALVRSNVALTARPSGLVFSLEWDACRSILRDPFCPRPILLNAPKTSPPA